MTERAIDGIFNEDCITGVEHLADGSVDLVIADPPYGLGKDYGNDS
ncbi:MAG: site-specific DNA-methyltransferase, partial [Actinobacteria bacterium]|nr:site-specific DNA-methyltransferase [Actinomycetota bacterium]